MHQHQYMMQININIIIYYLFKNIKPFQLDKMFIKKYLKKL